jgi:hypothetical protein
LSQDLHKTETKFEDEAIDIVSSWYESKVNLETMTRRDKLALIWEKQIE